MSQKTEDIFDEVLEERDRQDEKFGDQTGLPQERWLTILTEEVGEAARAILEGDEEGYREELVQIAAVAVAAVESYDAQE